jgi:hypothetical protein
MRKSKREIERGLDELDEKEQLTLEDYMWADLKDYHGGRLTPVERRLLEDPAAYLSPAAQRQIGLGGESA